MFSLIVNLKISLTHTNFYSMHPAKHFVTIHGWLTTRHFAASAGIILRTNILYARNRSHPKIIINTSPITRSLKALYRAVKQKSHISFGAKSRETLWDFLTQTCLTRCDISLTRCLNQTFPICLKAKHLHKKPRDFMQSCFLFLCILNVVVIFIIFL